MASLIQRAELGAAPRTAIAWYAILEALADGEWHPHMDLVDVALGRSDLTVKTCHNLLGEARRGGDLEWEKIPGTRHFRYRRRS